MFIKFPQSRNRIRDQTASKRIQLLRSVELHYSSATHALHHLMRYAHLDRPNSILDIHNDIRVLLLAGHFCDAHLVLLIVEVEMVESSISQLLQFQSDIQQLEYYGGNMSP